jgi:hypothetical protein
MLLGVGLILCLGGAEGGEKGEKKETTLKGKITCAKCDLGKETSCMTVIVVKKDKKDVVYYFDKGGHKKYHEDVCTEAKQGTVTGVTSKKGDKNIVTVSKVEYK